MSDATRQRLREAARRALRHPDRATALELWRGLLAGRLSVIDRFDGDGRHYLIARRNPPRFYERRALSSRELEVSGYLRRGLSNKLIGHCLGISTSAAADHVSAIARKLRIGSRVELVRLLNVLEG